MKPVILVTGALGFVGRHVISSLLPKDCSLRLIVREGKGVEVFSMWPDAEIIETKDMFSESTSWWELQCANVDIVLHLAWFTEVGQYLESTKNFDCLIGSLNLACAATKAGVTRFVGIGTCFEYDLTMGVVSINSPLKPTTIYATSKVALYLTLKKLLASANIKFSWCRIFYLYGEGEDDRRLVPYLHGCLKQGIQANLSTGKQIRDYMNVSDVGRMIAKLALSEGAGTFNLCSGNPVTVRQLAENIADLYERRDLLCFGSRPDDPDDPHCVVGIPLLP